jgi:integrase
MIMFNKDNLTFGEFAEPFFSERCLRLKRYRKRGREFAPHYISEQRRILKSHILTDNELCSLAVKDISRIHLEAYIDRVINLLGYTRTAQTVNVLLKLIVKELYNYDYIEKDLSKILGSIYYQEKTRDILTADEIRIFLSGEPFESLKERTFFTVSYLCGLRKGEVLALKWQDINFKDNAVSIVRAWKNDKVLGLPKSGKPRTTWLPPLAKELLLAYCAKDCIYDSLVFTGNGNGQRLGNTWVQKHFVKVIERIGIDRNERNITFHSLRHTLKSELSYSGVPKETQRMLFGWSINSADKMAERYTHLDKTQIAGLIEQYVL